MRRRTGRRAAVAVLTILAGLSLSACSKDAPPAGGSGANAPRDGQAQGEGSSSVAEERGSSGAAAAGATAAADDPVILGLNAAAGILGQFRFEDAERWYRTLLTDLDAGAIPGRGKDAGLRARIVRSLAIATLNQTSEGAQERAIALLEPLIAADPNDLQARYCTGLAQLYLGLPDEAAGQFAAVAAARPTDAYALYYLGQCQEFGDHATEAMASYQASAAADPLLRSPLLGIQRLAARAGDDAKADEALARFQALADHPQARLAEFKYTRMGALAEVSLPDERPTAPTTNGQPVLVKQTIELQGALPAMPHRDVASLTAADIDGDGATDLFLAGAGDEGRSVVLLAAGAGYRVVDDHPLATVDHVRAALWGDIDEDGHLDVYLCRMGANQWMRGDGHGGYVAAPPESGAEGGAGDTVDGALADLDHDGDLDLFLCRADGPAELLANIAGGGEGGASAATFRPIGAESGAIGDGRPVRSVIIQDVDGDRDADLLLLHASGPNELLLNDRVWRYTRATDLGPIASTAVAGAVAGDWDATGQVEFLLIGADGAPQRATREGGGWSIRTLTTAGAALEGPSAGPTGRRDAAVVDLVGRGDPQLVWRHDASVVAIDRAGTNVCRVDLAEGEAGPWAVVERGLDGPSIAMVGATGLTILGPGPGRQGFVPVRFAGRLNQSLSMRSNGSGIGTRFAARIGSHWVGGTTFRASTAPGQSLQPISIGVGDRSGIDFLAVTWSDGVFQSELSLRRDEATTVVETQRQISSCPVIFVWDGTDHRFVTDCLGVGGIGYLVAPGEYAPPRPWERLLLPADCVPALRDGTAEVRLGEPMEEACYLDAARLVEWRVPSGWSMTIDERMALDGPEVTGEPRFYRRSLRPQSVIDEAGREHRDEVAAADGRAIPLDDVDPRCIGYLRRPRILTLEFPEPLDGLPGEPTLVAHGWVEYPYCQTNFAAWQAGKALLAPDLEARGADGRWRRVLPPWGYPAGMPREMSLPLHGLPKGTTALRLTTTQEIYWDAFLVAGVEPCPEAQRREWPLRAASVADAGFPERLARPEKRPDYRYASRVPLWDTRHQPGFYTAFGSCTELVSGTDDALAVFGPGEEIRLRFAPPADGLSESLSAGERRLILELDGWCKDLDLFTRDGERLEPLPTRGGGPRGAEAEALHRRFNTRYRDGF